MLTSRFGGPCPLMSLSQSIVILDSMHLVVTNVVPQDLNRGISSPKSNTDNVERSKGGFYTKSNARTWRQG